MAFNTSSDQINTVVTWDSGRSPAPPGDTEPAGGRQSGPFQPPPAPNLQGNLPDTREPNLSHFNSSFNLQTVAPTSPWLHTAHDYTRKHLATYRVVQHRVRLTQTDRAGQVSVHRRKAAFGVNVRLSNKICIYTRVRVYIYLSFFYIWLDIHLNLCTFIINKTSNHKKTLHCLNKHTHMHTNVPPPSFSLLLRKVQGGEIQ